MSAGVEPRHAPRALYEVMRYLHTLAVDEPTLPKDIFEELCRLKPDARKPTGFRLEVISANPDGDDFIQYALALLKKYGATRRYHSSATHYGYRISRFYEKTDLSSAAFLILDSQKQIQSLTEPERDEYGQLMLVASNVKPVLKIGSIFPNWIIVSDKVRGQLEIGSFVGLRFCKVAIKANAGNPSHDPFWELQSSITLPKMVNTHQFVHRGLTEAEPFAGDYSRSILINDTPFTSGEVHYRNSDLAAISPFDIATTFENYLERHPALVVSQRFYQHCLKNKIPLEVRPARVDPN